MKGDIKRIIPDFEYHQIALFYKIYSNSSIEYVFVDLKQTKSSLVNQHLLLKFHVRSYFHTLFQRNRKGVRYLRVVFPM